MAIEKLKSGKYRVRVNDKSLNRMVHVGTYPTKAQSTSAERKAMTEMLADGAIVKPKDITFGDACDAYLRTTAALAPSTQVWYENALKPARKFFGEKTSVRRLTRERVQEFLGSLIARKLAATTVCSYIKVVSVVMDYCIELGYRSDNPARKLRGVPEKKPVAGSSRAITVAEHGRLVESVATEFRQGRGHIHYRGYQVMVEMMPNVGLRRSEIQALRWDAIDLNARTVAVEFQLRDDGTLDPRLKTPKSHRVVELTHGTVQLLRGWKAESHTNSRNLVFPTQRGLAQNSAQFYRIWTTACDKAELVGLDPHDMRHTFASWNLAAGCSPRWLADQMGHGKVSMLLDVYAHLLPNANEEAMEKREAWGKKQRLRLVSCHIPDTLAVSTV